MDVNKIEDLKKLNEEEFFSFLQTIDPLAEEMECPYSNDGFPNIKKIDSWKKPNVFYFYKTFCGKYGPYTTKLYGISSNYSEIVFSILSEIDPDETSGRVGDDFLNLQVGRNK